MPVIANWSILYRGRMYGKGEVIPNPDPKMVEAWKDSGAASFVDGKKLKAKAKAEEGAAAKAKAEEEAARAEEEAAAMARAEEEAAATAKAEEEAAAKATPPKAGKAAAKGK